MVFQSTVSREARFTGVGLHTGAPVTLSVRPAVVDSGFRFVIARPGMQPVTIHARSGNIQATSYATSLGQDGVQLHTVEHLLAALAGLEVDNAEMWLDSCEVPVMDGSAMPFVEGLKAVGRVEQSKERSAVRITRPLRVEAEGKWIELLPAAVPGLTIDYAIDFEHPSVGQQRFHLELSPQNFENELAAARTFGFAAEVDYLKSRGLARGGSLDNAVVIGEDGVLNPGGLRFADEPVRHKVLDLVGDLALLGFPLWGHLIAHRSGHALHTRLVEEILRRPDCWEYVHGAEPAALAV
ncbi:MAG: UDP-3-O-acyl-N-acetylglucosamine deacetylase [Nitrospirota bacterium]|nr:UDP-3-O-acyl-N-acetylglucosamine deacetylase [Nitrospirota bacterium]